MVTPQVRHPEKNFHYSPGVMERAEAFIFFIAMMLWPSAFGKLAALFSVLVLFTAGIRLHQFYQQIPHEPSVDSISCIDARDKK